MNALIFEKLNVFQMSRNAQKKLTNVEEEKTAQTLQIHTSASVQKDTYGKGKIAQV
jgi:hypothetical protein